MGFIAKRQMTYLDLSMGIDSLEILINMVKENNSNKFQTLKYINRGEAQILVEE